MLFFSFREPPFATCKFTFDPKLKLVYIAWNVALTSRYMMRALPVYGFPLRFLDFSLLPASFYKRLSYNLKRAIAVPYIRKVR